MGISMYMCAWPYVYYIVQKNWRLCLLTHYHQLVSPYMVTLGLCLQPEVHFCMLLLDMTSHTTAKALDECLLEQPQYVRRVHEATLAIGNGARRFHSLPNAESNCRWSTCRVCTWSCSYQRCCQVRADKENSYGNDCCSPSVVYFYTQPRVRPNQHHPM